ncbi:3'-5' exonuclease [Thiobacillus sp.]
MPDLGLEETTALLVPATVVLKGQFAVIETKNTGRTAGTAEIFEIAALRIQEGQVVNEYSTLVRTTRALPASTYQTTGIHDGILAESGISLQDAMAEVLAMAGDAFLFAYDSRTHELLAHAANQYRIPFKNPFGGVTDLARVAWPNLNSYAMPILMRHLKMPPASTATAMELAVASLSILTLATKTLTGPGGRLSRALVHWGNSPDTIKLIPTPW